MLKFFHEFSRKTRTKTFKRCSVLLLLIYIITDNQLLIKDFKQSKQHFSQTTTITHKITSFQFASSYNMIYEHDLPCFVSTYNCKMMERIYEALETGWKSAFEKFGKFG